MAHFSARGQAAVAQRHLVVAIASFFRSISLASMGGGGGGTAQGTALNQAHAGAPHPSLGTQGTVPGEGVMGGSVGAGGSFGLPNGLGGNMAMANGHAHGLGHGHGLAHGLGPSGGMGPGAGSGAGGVGGSGGLQGSAHSKGGDTLQVRAELHVQGQEEGLYSSESCE